jgi:hypothetical protein
MFMPQWYTHVPKMQDDAHVYPTMVHQQQGMQQGMMPPIQASRGAH